jgi:hypothetical protein
MSNLTSKIRALSHTTSDCNARIETWSLACVVLLVPRAKFHIFGHSNELRKGLDCIFGAALLNFFETGQYDFHYVRWSKWILLLWCEQRARGLNSRLL